MASASVHVAHRVRWCFRIILIEDSIQYRTKIRNEIERVLGVRPRLENPDHAEREVANLLRAKDAIEVLESPP